jgi:hypothetical protein
MMAEGQVYRVKVWSGAEPSCGRAPSVAMAGATDVEWIVVIHEHQSLCITLGNIFEIRALPRLTRTDGIDKTEFGACRKLIIE